MKEKYKTNQKKKKKNSAEQFDKSAKCESDRGSTNRCHSPPLLLLSEELVYQYIHSVLVSSFSFFFLFLFFDSLARLNHTRCTHTCPRTLLHAHIQHAHTLLSYFHSRIFFLSSLFFSPSPPSLSFHDNYLYIDNN